MKKKIIKQVALISLFISTGSSACFAEAPGMVKVGDQILTTPAVNPVAQVLIPNPGIINITDTEPAKQADAPAKADAEPAKQVDVSAKPEASTPPAAAPSAPAPAPEPAAPAPEASAPHAEVQIDYNKPLVPETQFFRYRCLNSAHVTLNSLKAMDCHRLERLYAEDPQRAIDHVSLLLLIQRVLEGADVRNMPQQDRLDLAYATILGELRKYGRVEETRGYMGLTHGECYDRLIFPSVASLCQILEGVKGAIILELYHYKLIFPQA